MKTIKLFNFPKDQQVLVDFRDEYDEIRISVNYGNPDECGRCDYTINSGEYLPLRITFENFSKEQAKQYIVE